MNSPMIRPTPRALIVKALRDEGFQVLEGPISRNAVGQMTEQVYILGGNVAIPENALREVGRRVEEVRLDYVPTARHTARESLFRGVIEGLSRVLDYSTSAWGENTRYSGAGGAPRPVLEARVFVEQ